MKGLMFLFNTQRLQLIQDRFFKSEPLILEYTQRNFRISSKSLPSTIRETYRIRLEYLQEPRFR